MTTSRSNTRTKFAPRIPREVAALLAALHLQGAETDSLRTLSDTEWHSLLRFCELAHLTLPLAQLRVDGIPPWVIERLQTNLADNTLRFERVRSTYREAAQALDRAGVDYIVIKGFTQAPDYVPDPRLRQQSDLDLVCRPNQIARALSALEALGYCADQRMDVTNTDHTPTMIRLGDWQWRGNVFDPTMPLSIELHFCLWNEPVSLLAVSETEQFWERRTQRALAGMQFSALSPVDHLGHLTLHILRNLLLRDWIVHHVYELAVFLHAHAGDDAFWDQWKAMHSGSLRAKEAIAFFHAAAWFGCDLHPAVEDQIAALPEIQLEWLRHFTWSAFEGMFRTNKDSVWLQMSLLHGPKKKLALLKRSFLPQATTTLNSPRVTTRNRRRVDLDDSRPYLRYAAYLASRTLSHSRMNLSALVRGLSWRLSQHHLAPQFWIFLAASFFLTSACPSTSSSSIFS